MSGTGCGGHESRAVCVLPLLHLQGSVQGLGDRRQSRRRLHPASSSAGLPDSDWRQKSSPRTENPDLLQPSLQDWAPNNEVIGKQQVRMNSNRTVSGTLIYNLVLVL